MEANLRSRAGGVEARTAARERRGRAACSGDVARARSADGVRAARPGDRRPRLGRLPALCPARGRRRRRRRAHRCHGRRRRVGRSPAAQSSCAGSWTSAGQLGRASNRSRPSSTTIVVRAELDRHAGPTNPGKRIDYSRFTATIVDRRTGARRGFVRWFDTAQVLTWKIEGGSQGVILPERLPGGWTFTPTMAWANVQAYQFATQAAKTLEPDEPFAGLAGACSGRPRRRRRSLQMAQGRGAAAVGRTRGVGRRGSRRPGRRAGARGRVDAPRGRSGARGGAVVNEPGCDNLHWLDGSDVPRLLRPARPLLRDQRVQCLQLVVAVLGKLVVRALQRPGRVLLLHGVQPGLLWRRRRSGQAATAERVVAAAGRWPAASVRSSARHARRGEGAAPRVRHDRAAGSEAGDDRMGRCGGVLAWLIGVIVLGLELAGA